MKLFEPAKIGKLSIKNRVIITTMQETADTVGKYLPQAPIAFDWDRSEEMKAANICNSYDVDNTAAREEFGWQPHYSLDKAVSDFIEEIKAGRAG